MCHIRRVAIASESIGTDPQKIVLVDNSRGMRRLFELMQYDRPGLNPAEQAAKYLLARRGGAIWVCTGFPIKRAGGAYETDGPPGAWALSEMLVKFGYCVKLIIPAGLVDILKSVFSEFRPGFEYTSLEAVNTEHATNHTVVCSIEVCGACDDGKYRNMLGEDISGLVPRFEEKLGWNMDIAIGDGGNELGMGSAPRLFFDEMGVSRPKSTATNLVPASVSNYGAYAIMAELLRNTVRECSVMGDSWIEGHLKLISSMVKAGLVDGFSGERIEKVDGNGLEETAKVLKALWRC